MTSARYGVALLATTFGCQAGTESDLLWSGRVEAEVDDLTGARTGVFRTYGPTVTLAAGNDTIPITIGYYCRTSQPDSFPPRTIDDLFFRVAMPDTSLTRNNVAALEELQGMLGLLDAARMAVDGREVAPWRYDAELVPGTAYFDGAGYPLPDGVLSAVPLTVDRAEREAYVAESVLDGVRDAPPILWTKEAAAVVVGRCTTCETVGNEVRATHPAAYDAISADYGKSGHLAVEFAQVARFPMENFSAAVDSVRFWCPVEDSHREWNAVRDSVLIVLDSALALVEQRMRAVRAEVTQLTKGHRYDPARGFLPTGVPLGARR